MLEFAFWAAFGLVAYTYLGFPLLLLIRRRLWKRAPKCADILPTVTLIVTAHNEESCIRERLENILALDYPRELLSVLVASDGSTDATNRIVAEFADHGIGLLALPRGGKQATINAAVQHARDEILVFTDANSMTRPDALRWLVRPFADPAVGGVAGCQIYRKADEAGTGETGERAYWTINQAIGEWESDAGSITNTTGAWHAIRRELFEPIPPGTVDDVAMSFAVLSRHYRLVYEPRAIAEEDVAPTSQAEFQRKMRICAMGFHSVAAYRQLLNPFRYGFLSFQIVSRKLLRWAVPWPLLAMFFSSLALASRGGFYGAVFVLQAVFYAAALLAALLPRRIKLPKALSLPFFFCLGNLASLVAQWKTARGSQFNRWAPTPRLAESAQTAADSQPAPKTAYMMSRFPKITETFILYEILEIQKHGFVIEIFPLMREHETVIHPDAVPLVEKAHFLPFLSWGILAANLRCLRRQPRVYFNTLWEVLRGTWGSTNFFLGAVVFFPKSVAFAERMQQMGITHVHAHFATHPALSALIVHRLSGIPFSFTAHGHDVHCDCRMLDAKVDAAAFTISISRYNRELMIKECGVRSGDKIRVLHCGADTSFFTPPAHPRPAAALRIVCVAGLRGMKGHEYLVEAARLLRDRGVAFHCDLVGEGECRPAIMSRIAEAGLGDHITLHGAQPRENVRRLLRQASVKVLPSIWAPNGMREGIPVALMEAMACGLPVVSSELSGIPELVENGVSGVLVPPRDAVALADTLERLDEDPALRERMGAAGRERVLREFDLAANAAALAGMFGQGTAVSEEVSQAA